ncbi:MlaD family protein [Tsukamurella sp. 1534]|uniref:MlaD family protein n=1 Tax=Tsukamurella sp. 1534 TaxID=1151061 RepID=UPI0009DA628A|nr:MlaD family protein [Tsukamurella sp. 1534]
MSTIASVPGMTVEPRQLVRRGAITVAVVAVVALVAWGITALLRPSPMRVTLAASSVAPGVSNRTVIEMNGVRIGTVSGVDQLGSGRLGVVMDLDPDQGRKLTDKFRADFAPNNLFGVTSMQVIPASDGTPLRDGAVITPVATPGDSSMSNLLRSLADVESTALRPYMSELIRQADTATTGFLPMVRALGAVAEANADTQTVPTSQTLPILASALQGVGASSNDLLSALKMLWDWPAPDVPGYAEKQTATITALRDLTAPDLANLVKNLQPLEPVLNSVVDIDRRMVKSMPDAAHNGRQISDLIETIRKAIKDTPNGKVLDLDVQARPVPIPASPAAQQGGGR